MLDGASRPRVTHAEHDGVHVLRYFGRVGYPLAPALRAFVEGVIDAPGSRGVVFDLTSAESLDSTSWGLLVRLGMRARERARPALVIPGGGEIRELLGALCIDRLLDVVEDHPAVSAAAAATTPQTALEAAAVVDGRALRLHMLDAHRALMALSATNEERFREVVTWLAAEGDEDAGEPPPARRTEGAGAGAV